MEAQKPSFKLRADGIQRQRRISVDCPLGFSQSEVVPKVPQLFPSCRVAYARQLVRCYALVLKPFATAEIKQNEIDGHLAVPIFPAEGLTTQVVRALDAAGVAVNDVTIRRASLDDVFFALTGHASASDTTEGTEAA